MPAALLRLASDQRLVEQVRGGSERAFEVLFDRYHRPVFAFCRHLLGSREEAEDAVQLTFLAAYRDLVYAQAPSTLRPWLYAIARHRCLSILRARREHPVAEVPEPATDHLAASVATREDLRVILADVARLPDDQRTALVLAELGDVSHNEIAQILACPREKVKALVFQARSSLIAGRAARETPCDEIREQLAILRGSALRRTPFHRHLHDCPGCRAFREQVRVQRRALGLLLPVAPGVGLKRMVLGAVFGSGAGGAGGAALTTVALNWGGLAAALVVLAVPTGGPAAVARALGDRGDAPRVTPVAQRTAPPSAGQGPRSEQALAARLHPGSAALSPDVTQPRKDSVQAAGNAKATDPAEPAHRSGPAEPAHSQHAVPSEPLTANGQTSPATPPKPHGPPADNGRPPSANIANPAKAPQANGHPAPTTPNTPPQANGHPTPATPNTPPLADGQSTPAESNRHADGPRPAARDASPGPAVTPGPSRSVSGTPDVPGNGGQGVGGHGQR